MTLAMSNLTSASNEASLSSSGTNRNEISTLYPQQYSVQSSNQTQSAKRKRNLPGNPDPEAEVIALSPKSLMTTNGFICEICNKGFKRDQNLQLHRRGHNLPWKLKQRPKQEVVRKKVYVCPEATCVHHEPSRALGDLTGIKKHFSRKHGEKKWKCEKCSKRYAVQSDWKAHSKICGTREYRCDCGTLFSRRDSFITHRAFCEALAEETGRSTNSTANPFFSSSSLHLPHHHQALKREQLINNIHNINDINIPAWLGNINNQVHHMPSEILFPSSSSVKHSGIDHDQTPPPSFQSPAAAMSATALLQKATEMGVTMGGHVPTAAGLSARDQMETGFHHHASFGNNAATIASNNRRVGGGNVIVTSGCMEQFGTTTGGAPPPPPSSSLLLHHADMDMDMMRSSVSSFGGQEGEEAFNNINGMFNPKLASKKGDHDLGLTRDFLGLRGFPLNMDGDLDQITTTTSSSSSYHHHRHRHPNQNHTPWQG